MKIVRREKYHAVLGIRLEMLKLYIQGQLCIKWMSFREKNDAFCDSSGQMAGDAEILHSKPLMNQMDENRIFVQEIMRSGTVLVTRLGMQLCTKWMNIVFS